MPREPPRVGLKANLVERIDAVRPALSGLGHGITRSEVLNVLVEIGLQEIEPLLSDPTSVAGRAVLARLADVARSRGRPGAVPAPVRARPQKRQRASHLP